MTPFNGRLFAPARTPLAERRDLDDEAARRAVVALSTRPARRSRRPRADRLPRSRRRAARRRLRDAARLRAAHRARGARRAAAAARACARRPAPSTRRSRSPTTSSAARSVRSCATRTPDRILQLRVVDPAMGSGAFLVAACRYLADALRGGADSRPAAAIATDFGDAERAAIRRTIARALPLRRRPQPDGGAARAAVALARDARGRSAAQLSRSSSAGRRQPARRLARRTCGTRRRLGAGARATVGALPLFGDDDGRDARCARRCRSVSRWSGAERHHRAGAREGARARRADGARLGARAMEAGRGSLVRARGSAEPRPRRRPRAFGSLSDAALTGRSALPARSRGGISTRPDAAAESRRLFHWELEFPEVFFDRDGDRRPHAGFDAVIGNPPWDMLRADQGEADARARARLDTRRCSASRATPASTRRSPAATPTATSCSSSARSR